MTAQQPEAVPEAWVVPEASGLFDPKREYDACGVGFIADLKGGAVAQDRQGRAGDPGEPRASRRGRRRPDRGRRRRHPHPDPARLPPGGVRQAQHQAAEARPLRRRPPLHAAGRAAARALRARVDAHHPRGGPGVPGLALGAGRQLVPVGDGEGHRAGAPADLHRPAEGDEGSARSSSAGSISSARSSPTPSTTPTRTATSATTPCRCRAARSSTRACSCPTR